MNIVPTVMIKNEEAWIRDVLAPLVGLFDHVIVTDTGSTDSTLDILDVWEERYYPKMIVSRMGTQTPRGLSETRRAQNVQARQVGYEYSLLVDGDEIYSRRGLESILATPIPEGTLLGYTAALSIDIDEEGRFWELADLYSRQALTRTDVLWHGDYPFEAPAVYATKEGTAHSIYFPTPPDDRYHYVHVHRLTRSPQDDQVRMRLQKQKLFSLQAVEIPRTLPFDLEAWRAA